MCEPGAPDTLSTFGECRGREQGMREGRQTAGVKEGKKGKRCCGVL